MKFGIWNMLYENTESLTQPMFKKFNILQIDFIMFVAKQWDVEYHELFKNKDLFKQLTEAFRREFYKNQSFEYDEKDVKISDEIKKYIKDFFNNYGKNN